MRILAYNPGHDGAIVSLVDRRLELSLESEKDSNYRYSSVSSPNVFSATGELAEIPDAVCMGGWWPRDHHEFVQGSISNAGYRGISEEGVILGERRFLGRDVRYFSSSHERSHILCAYGMSPLPKGTPCYALVWEGAIGAFYEIDADLNMARVADVMEQPGTATGSSTALPTRPSRRMVSTPSVGRREDRRGRPSSATAASLFRAKMRAVSASRSSPRPSVTNLSVVRNQMRTTQLPWRDPLRTRRPKLGNSASHNIALGPSIWWKRRATLPFKTSRPARAVDR